MIIAFVVNGKSIQIETAPTKRLLDLLRDDLGLVGAKEGCGEGECGACSILVDGLLTNSCLVACGAVIGKQIETIEGFRDTAKYKIIEQAYADAGAVQCGFCIPGMVMATESLLRQNAYPDEMAVREAISGNLCRCTGYHMIVEAVLLAAERGRGLWS